MFWIGLEPGDVHLNVASPGWAKHAWSNFFTPWIAEATVFIYNYKRFDPVALMNQMDARHVTSFCAPPTVWRLLIQADLSELKNPPQKLVSAGEPLNAEVIDQVNNAWGQVIRDGFGQTETTVQIANPPGEQITIGAMGRPMPGYEIVLRDPATGEEGDLGEICLVTAQRPLGLMKGYFENEEKTNEVFRDGVYHTGDIAERDEPGVLTYVGRADDVFKSSDYKISPFELESVLIEHPGSLKRQWFRHRMNCDSPFPRPTLLLLAVMSRARNWPNRFWLIAASISRLSSACAGSNSRICPRRSRARSAVWSCAKQKSSAMAEAPRQEPNTRTPISRT